MCNFLAGNDSGNKRNNMLLRFLSFSLSAVPESWYSILIYPTPNLHLVFETQPSGKALAPRFLAHFLAGNDAGNKRTAAGKGEQRNFVFHGALF